MFDSNSVVCDNLSFIIIVGELLFLSCIYTPSFLCSKSLSFKMFPDDQNVFFKSTWLFFKEHFIFYFFIQSWKTFNFAIRPCMFYVRQMLLNKKSLGNSLYDKGCWSLNHFWKYFWSIELRHTYQLRRNYKSFHKSIRLFKYVPDCS